MSKYVFYAIASPFKRDYYEALKERKILSMVYQKLTGIETKFIWIGESDHIRGMIIIGYEIIRDFNNTNEIEYLLKQRTRLNYIYET